MITYYNKTNPISMLFKNDIERSIKNIQSSYSTKIKAKELDDKYILSCELPGYEKKQISVSINDHTLSISASNEDFGEKSRKILLPPDIDESSITACLKNGVLSINISKKDELKPIKVKIE